MCNNYERRICYTEYQRVLRKFGMAPAAAQGEHDMPRADDVRIGDTAPVMRQAGKVVELAPMRFGLSPARPKGKPIFNYRSEGRRFGLAHRCLIPASAFFEFTGDRYPKTKHRFTLYDATFMAIAGIWRPGEGNQPPAFAMLTVDPGPDVRPNPRPPGSRAAAVQVAGLVERGWR
jgi:putative SOS response-associated peptidase YedK